MGSPITRSNDQEKIWDYYQNVSPEYFAIAKPRIDFIIKQMSLKKIDPLPCVLNIGAGDGYLEKTLKKKRWDIYLLDPNKKVIERMMKMDIKGYSGYIEEMPFEREKFDFVVASEVLEHLSDEQRSRGIREIARVLKPGGVFLGTVPYSENLNASQIVCPECGGIFHRWGHQKSFDIPTISAELSESLKVLEVRRTAFVFFKGQSLSRKIKTLIKLILAKCGEMIATPGIYFCAKKM